MNEKTEQEIYNQIDRIDSLHNFDKIIVEGFDHNSNKKVLTFCPNCGNYISEK